MHETISHLNSADFLFHQLRQEGLEYGCLEVSLEALGGATDLVDLLNGNPSQVSYIIDILQRKGFEPHWLSEITADFTGEDIETVLTDQVEFPDPRPRGKMAGYLGLIDYEDENRVNHAIAILPRHLMPRDMRRTLKQIRSYVVVDTSSIGTFIAPADWIADYARSVIGDGGSFAITQLWRVR